MLIFIIIYSIGYILSYRMHRKHMRKTYRYTVSDRIINLLFSLGSWITFIINVIIYYNDPSIVSVSKKAKW